MAKQGLQDPGPKKHKGALSWDQMKLWNKYYDQNSGKSVDEIFSIMAKENPDAVKDLSVEKLKGVFKEQSMSAYDKEMRDYEQAKASGKFDSDRWANEKKAGWSADWIPQYKSINKFLPAQYMPPKGEAVDLGLTNEYGEFENPNNYKIAAGAPIKADIAKQLPTDIKLDDIEEDEQYSGFVNYIDPQEGRMKYVSVKEAESRFGKDWHNKVATRNKEKIEAAKKRRAELEERLGQNQG